MKRVLVDGEILLDILLDRDVFAEEASKLWQLVESEQIEAYVTPTTLSKIFEIGRESQGVEIAWQAVSQFQEIMKVCPVDANIIQKASSFKLDDFEVAVQLACATVMKLDVIITRKIQEFYPFFQDFQDIYEGIFSVVTAEEFLERLFSRSQWADLFRYFEEANKRLDVSKRITSNASRIVANSVDTLLTEQTKLIEPDGTNRYTEGQIAACLHYLEILLRYIVYALVAGDLNVLKEGCLKDGWRETYQARGIACESMIVAVQKMKQAAIAIANDPKGITPGNSCTVICELAAYFDCVVTALAESQGL
jgi:phycocyanin beta chain